MTKQTKDEKLNWIYSDMIEIFKIKGKLHKLLNHLEEDIWAISIIEGKYTTRFMSEEALKQKEKNKKEGNKLSFELAHHHIYKIVGIVKKIEEAENLNVFFKILNTIIGCTLTQDEHDELKKDEYKGLDGWELLKKTNITIIDTEESKEKIIK